MLSKSKILIIGNDIAVSLVEGSLDAMTKNHDYDLISYTQAHYNDPDIDWSPQGVLRHMKSKGAKYDAIIVDYPRKDTVSAIKESGYTKPIIGLVSKSYDLMPGTDLIFLLNINSKPSLKQVLDDLLR